jgi:hypothetical protein
MKKLPKLGLAGKILTGVSATLATVIPILSGCAAPQDPYYSHQNQTTNQGQSVPDYLGTTNPKNQAMAGVIFQDWGAGSNPALNAGQQRAYSLFGQHLSSQAPINAVNQGFEKQRQYIDNQRIQEKRENQIKSTRNNNSNIKPIKSLIKLCSFAEDLNNDGIINLENEVRDVKSVYLKKGDPLIILYGIENIGPNTPVSGELYSPSQDLVFNSGLVNSKGDDNMNIFESNISGKSLSDSLHEDYGSGIYTFQLFLGQGKIKTNEIKFQITE